MRSRWLRAPAAKQVFGGGCDTGAGVGSLAWNGMEGRCNMGTATRSFGNFCFFCIIAAVAAVGLITLGVVIWGALL